MKIEEPYKSRIRSIINEETDSDKIVSRLKIYMLVNKEYFNELISGLDVGWLAKEIYLQHKNNIKNKP